MFFSFDGIDGAGKSTQLRLFCERLSAHGLDVVACRDPGSTELGERIRDIVLSHGGATPIARRSEMLLYMAARAQLVEEVIRPALATGKIVVCDRFLLANIVYQGHAGGVDVSDVRQVGAIATDGVLPGCVFLLDVAVENADRRISRPLDRMESQGPEYRRRLREGFLAEAARSEGRIHVIDANQAIDAVQSDIWRIAAQQLGLAHR
ncbi:MAG TPA: dTMP kinase [Lacipirellulaceae bacterium]|nr:dTMP kinase [Lacipirellulaceae bacterium]HJS08851.1 dTMP kinase [Pirellulales bacterium]